METKKIIDQMGRIIGDLSKGLAENIFPFVDVSRISVIIRFKE